MRKILVTFVYLVVGAVAVSSLNGCIGLLAATAIQSSPGLMSVVVPENTLQHQRERAEKSNQIAEQRRQEQESPTVTNAPPPSAESK
ncbi:MAG: hypothetical protein PHX25_01415 [Candidatus Pacebacteria bacterium]|nr:hypothetical protein [Candidatus Paceibacterota bacterium]